METAALVLAVLALLLALAARAKAAGLAGRIEEASADSRRRAENVQEAVERALETERRLLAQIAAGARLSREQILEGRLWGEVEPREAAELVAGGDVRLLDVRTPQETAAGIIPGAQRIPVDELPQRLREVPRDGRTTLVYCAGGARSAAACELLAQHGHEGLLNLAGGFSSWSGPRARPGDESA